MNSFDVKLEKANAILRYRRRRSFTTLFRFMELVVFLIVISRFSVQLPVAFRLSGDYFRGLSLSVISPRFVFVLGNAIILILFLKAGGHYSSRDDGNSSIKIDLRGGNINNCEKDPETIISREEIEPRRRMHRSQSEILKREKFVDTSRKLRRTVTETRRKSVDNSEKSPASTCVEEEMSGEEFRRTVEAFIARQQRSLREEEFEAIVSMGP